MSASTEPRPHFLDATTLEAADAGSEFDDTTRLSLVLQAADGLLAIDLPQGSSLTLGRAEEADVVVADPSLSRLHARFSRQGDRIQVVDLASRNGTWFEGKRIQEASLRAGSALALGSISGSIQRSASPQAASLGLLSSSAMLELLEDECARSRIFRRPLSLLLLRAQRPSRLGMAELARRCVPRLRAFDHAAPHARQALAILLPETDARAALAAAKQLLAAVSGEDMLACAIASSPEAGAQPSQLLAAGERALERCTRAEPCQVAGAGHTSEPVALTPAPPRAPRCNPAMLELERLVERLAPRRLNVLVLGETGTGKELVARDLHRLSRRSQGPLKIVNCAAIPEALLESVLFGHVKGAFTGAVRDRPGVFAQAHCGSLFLDEVGELSAAAQAALLRALDTGRICPVGGTHELEVDVRVVAATHRDLASMAERGSFRLDLFHRLNGVSLRVPPLRERRDEIEGLARHFIAQLHDGASPPPRLSPAALARLHARDWPGNVRELRNVIERALALSDGDTLEVEEAPAAHSCSQPSASAAKPAENLTPDPELALRARLEAHEVELIREALRRTGGNQRRAAELLQLPLRTLERKLHILGLQARSS